MLFCKQDHQTVEPTACRGGTDCRSAVNHMFLDRGLGKYEWSDVEWSDLKRDDKTSKI
jgi:hypothetical protein